MKRLVPAIGGNRPLRRYIVRMTCLARFGKAGAHAEDWWPDLKLDLPGQGAAGEIRYRGGFVAPLLPYPKPGELDEIVVVGSGPSLAKQDRSKIRIDRALLVNGAIQLLERGKLPPLGVVIEDERFVWRHARMIMDRIPPATACYFSTGVIRALCETMPEWLAGQKVRHLDFLHRPHGRQRPDKATLRDLTFVRWSDDGEAAISLLPQSGVMPAGSVAATAAQIALFLAPKRIGLAGIDLTDTAEPRFYETRGHQAMSRVDRAAERILATLRLIGDECARRNILIENYSPTSRLVEIGLPYKPRLQ